MESDSPNKPAKRANFEHDEIVALLNIWSSPMVQDKFRGAKKSHKHIWREIASAMRKKHYSRTAEQCKDKVENLRRKYFMLKRGLVTDGSPPDWPYWSKLNNILESKSLPAPAVVEESFVENGDGDSNGTTSKGDIAYSSWSEIPQLTEVTTASTSVAAIPNKKRKAMASVRDIIEIIKDGQEEDRRWREENARQNEQFLALLSTLVHSMTYEQQALQNP